MRFERETTLMTGIPPWQPIVHRLMLVAAIGLAAMAAGISSAAAESGAEKRQRREVWREALEDQATTHRHGKESQGQKSAADGLVERNDQHEANRLIKEAKLMADPIMKAGEEAKRQIAEKMELQMREIDDQTERRLKAIYEPLEQRLKAIDDSVERNLREKESRSERQDRQADEAVERQKRAADEATERRLRAADDRLERHRKEADREQR